MVEEETKEVTMQDASKLLGEDGSPTIEKEQKKPFPYKSLIWYVGGYLIHVIIFIPIVILTAIIPEINTNSTFYLHAFERNNFFTMYFSFGKFLLWMIMCISGFSFVSMINLK
jgi:hypothetical protein